MFNASESTQLNTESLLNSFKRAYSGSSKKEVVEEYLQKYYETNNFHKVKDFPQTSEWINTTEPLSIHRDFKGKLVLLDFFTYCCINCMHVLPDLKELESKYSIEQGLVVIGVHCAKFTNEKQSKNIASAVKRYGVNHAVINDCDGTVWDAVDVSCWPTLALIGPNAELLLMLQGEGHLELLDNFIEVALKYMKEQNTLSDHSLPQIRITDELQSFGLLSFPGKVTSYCSDESRLLAVSDTGHHRILVLNDNGVVQNIIGGIQPGFKDGDFTTARFNSPQGLTFKDQHILYVADTDNHAIREIDLREKYVKTVAGTGKQGNDRIGGKLWIEQEISSPWDICFGKNKDTLLIAMAGTHQIWALYLSDEEYLFKKGKQGECKMIAGSGREENRNNCYPHAAAFAQPSGLTYCPERDSVFIADSESSSIRELNLETGKVSAVVGGNRNPSDLFAFGDIDGVAYDVKLQHLLGVAWDDTQKQLFVADSYNHKLKTVDVYKNCCRTVKLDATLNEPGGLCILNDQVLIADTNHHCIKTYDRKESSVSILSVTDVTKINTESASSDKILEISKKGGKLNINVKLNKSDDISLTEDAPAFWTISFADEQSKKMRVPEIREELKLESKFAVDVPQCSDKSNILVLMNGVMYVCKGALCSMEKISFVLKIRYCEEAKEDVSCELSHVIK